MKTPKLFYRIRQGIRYFYPNFNTKDEELAKIFLSEKEYELFTKMGEYDKKHSVNIVRDILKTNKSKDKDTLIHLGFLHDVGKDKNSIFSRIKKVILGYHTDAHDVKGYEKLKKFDEHIAWLVLNHHNKFVDEEILKVFQEYDDRN